jgi:hypothetical protein
MSDKKPTFLPTGTPRLGSNLSYDFQHQDWPQADLVRSSKRSFDIGASYRSSLWSENVAKREKEEGESDAKT